MNLMPFEKRAYTYGRQSMGEVIIREFEIGDYEAAYYRLYRTV